MSAFQRRIGASHVMSIRELVVLGTGSQVPTRHRNHNAYLLLWDSHGLLFDPGEGTQRQMIYSRVATSQITRILISHFHGDHCLGLAGLVQRISLDEVKHEVEISYPASGQVYVDRMRGASIFHDKSKLKLSPIAKEGVMSDGPDFELSCLHLEHGVETFGYRLQEPDARTFLSEELAKAGVVGRDIAKLRREGSIETPNGTVRVEDVSTVRKGQSFAFVMDTRYCEAAVELARGVDLLVCESTYLQTEAKEARERGHMTAREAAQVAKEAGADKLVLTHFSQRHPNTNDFLDEAKEVFENVVAARDGDRIAVPLRQRDL